jgi:predicted Zn-ribbon and HTH transcriptional regulator
MRVVERLRDQLGTDPVEQFECGLCTARYERRRSNCPACGSTEIREA